MQTPPETSAVTTESLLETAETSERKVKSTLGKEGRQGISAPRSSFVSTYSSVQEESRQTDSLHAGPKFIDFTQRQTFASHTLALVAIEWNPFTWDDIQSRISYAISFVHK